MPKEVDDLISHIRSQLPNPDMRINSCLMSKYKTGVNHIPAQRDKEPVINPESNINPCLNMLQKSNFQVL